MGQRMAGWRRPVASAATSMLVAGALVGCGIVTEIDDGPLEAAVAAMPGVEQAGVAYNDDYSDDGDVNVTLNVDVPSATPAQIRAVVDTANQHREDHLERIRLRVLPERFVAVEQSADEFDAGQIVDRTQRIRRLAAAFDGQITWAQKPGEPFSSLDVRQLTTPVPATLAAIRNELGGTPVDSYLVSAEPSPAPVWSVSFPFSAEQERIVDQHIAAMPVRPTSIRVGPNGIMTELDVEVSNRATAYDDLVTAISAAGTGPGRRLMLKWHYPVKDKRLTTGGGAVHVRGCEYPPSRFEQMPAEYLSVDELRLQERLRQEFDTCPR